MKIVLPDYKCISWNKLYSQGHWSVRSSLALEAHTEVFIALREMKIKPFTKQVDILIVAHLKRAIDSDNICAKIIIDGLKGSVIPDDTGKWVRNVTTRCEKSDRDYTEIIITEA